MNAMRTATAAHPMATCVDAQYIAAPYIAFDRCERCIAGIFALRDPL
jgi:hypothetical protein